MLLTKNNFAHGAFWLLNLLALLHLQQRPTSETHFYQTGTSVPALSSWPRFVHPPGLPTPSHCPSVLWLATTQNRSLNSAVYWLIFERGCTSLPAPSLHWASNPTFILSACQETDNWVHSNLIMGSLGRCYFSGWIRGLHCSQLIVQSSQWEIVQIFRHQEAHLGSQTTPLAVASCLDGLDMFSLKALSIKI